MLRKLLKITPIKHNCQSLATKWLSIGSQGRPRYQHITQRPFCPLC